MLDQGLSALVEDLHHRGLDKDVSVVVWGEFGCSPKVNPQGGRDHWPKASCAVLACGGLAVVGGTALYRLARRPDAVRLHDRLARFRIWVRRFDWADDLLRFGLPGSSANLDRLAAALSDAHR